MDRMSGVEQWAERHRLEGHHPHPAPTAENPERWDCDCRTIWRILTAEQIRQKFAHLKHDHPRRNLADDLPSGNPSGPPLLPPVGVRGPAPAWHVLESA